MSAALVARLDTPQCLMDELESTIWVILWVAIMYSPCSDIRAIPPFLDHTLDPQVKYQDSYTGKSDFLVGRALFRKVKFIGRPALDKLVKDLAVLFAARYQLLERESPERSPEEEFSHKRDEQYLAEIKDWLVRDPAAEFAQHALECNPLHQIQTAARNLETHTHTIAIFDAAITDLSQCVSDPPAAKQDIRAHLSLPPTRALKSGWVLDQTVGAASGYSGLKEAFQFLNVSDAQPEHSDSGFQ